MDPSTLSWLNFLIFNKFSLIFHKTTDFLTLTSYSPLELLQCQYDPITILTSSLSCQEFLFQNLQSLSNKVYWLQSALALFLQNFILITKKTPFNWLQLSTSWVLLGVQLAGQCGGNSLHYYLLAHSLSTKNLYLCVTCVFTMAYIWKQNSWGILLGYNGIL